MYLHFNIHNNSKSKLLLILFYMKSKDSRDELIDWCYDS